MTICQLTAAPGSVRRRRPCDYGSGPLGYPPLRPRQRSCRLRHRTPNRISHPGTAVCGRKAAARSQWSQTPSVAGFPPCAITEHKTNQPQRIRRVAICRWRCVLQDDPSRPLNCRAAVPSGEPGGICRRWRRRRRAGVSVGNRLRGRVRSRGGVAGLHAPGGAIDLAIELRR